MGRLCMRLAFTLATIWFTKQHRKTNSNNSRTVSSASLIHFSPFFFDLILFIDFNNTIKNRDLETPTNNFIFLFHLEKKKMEKDCYRNMVVSPSLVVFAVCANCQRKCSISRYIFTITDWRCTHTSMALWLYGLARVVCIRVELIIGIYYYCYYDDFTH